MIPGRLILIVGPSGSGKGTLVAALRDAFPNCVYPTSWTTRLPRPGELEGDSASGKKYKFVSETTFKENIDRGGFLEWAVYAGNFYGTPKHDVMDPIEKGKFVIQELELQGAHQLREHIPHELLTIIFIDAGSWELLRSRILARGEMHEEQLEQRRLRYEQEISFKPDADFIIHNEHGKIDIAKRQLLEIVQTLMVR